MPLDGQELDTTKYKRLVDYLGFSTLPNLNGRYLRADTSPNKMVNAGLPNITGTFVAAIRDGALISAKKAKITKAFYVHTASTYKGFNSVGDILSGFDTLGFDASKSNPIYGASNTVTPLTYTVRVYICYA